jgi:ferredoxin
MNKDLSIFVEKFNVPEILHNSIPKILNEDEIIILNHLADKEEKLSNLKSEFPSFGISLIESLHKRGYLIKLLKSGENYYRSNTFEQIVKRYVNHNPHYQELPEEEKISFQDCVMGLSLEKMRASQKPVYRVLPIEETIEDTRQLIPYHQAIHYLQEAKHITLKDCLCRTTFDNCTKPRKVCLALGEEAKFFAERKIGEKINLQRALKILNSAEKNGLVHSINNKEDPHYLCNCCECCCFFIQALKKRGIFTSMGESGYAASLDLELCNQCGICLDKCLFEAISDNGERIEFDEAKCFGCGLCAYNCPQQAVKLILKENENG